MSAVSLFTPAWIVLVWCYASSVLVAGQGKGTATGVFQPPTSEPLPGRDCPSNCGLLFGRLKNGTEGTGKFQHVEVQERGEPKSGTTFMYEWGSGALAHSCAYLQRAYGRESCRIEWTMNDRTLVFEPHLATEDDSAPCPCNNVEKVTIIFSHHLKHGLPVNGACTWSHGRGVAKKRLSICTPAKGQATPLKNQTDLWKCVRDAACEIVDNRLQLAVLRDPRAVAVSSYFYSIGHGQSLYGAHSVDEYVVEMLPTICQWVSLRYLLFEKMLKTRTSSFWYTDALADPKHWHERFLEFAGLHMPLHDVVHKAANIVTDGAPILGFPSVGIDTHLGGGSANVSRSYKDEVTADTLLGMDDVLRIWLPPILLEKLEVAP